MDDRRDNVIIVVDYGLGNIKSVSRALEKMGAEVDISSDPEAIQDASGIVVPGVGAFRKAMENIERAGLRGPIEAIISSGRPYLGICLGMQILFTQSHEYGRCPGLGFIEGEVLRFPDSVKIPHMGWNQVNISNGDPLYKGITDRSYFYFDHSYYTAPSASEAVSATTDYGMDFVSAVRKENVWGVQFHPEKSSSAGLRMLDNFVNICRGSI